MSDETPDLPGTEAAPSEGEQQSEKQAAEKTVTPAQQARRRSSVFVYLAVLFGAAFLLLLVTYMMELRDNRQLEQQYQAGQEQIEDLNQQSKSAVQSLNSLYAENETLKEQTELLQKQLDELKASAADSDAAAAEAEDRLEKTTLAMDWLWQLDEAWLDEDEDLCRSILSALEADTADPLTAYLPKESRTAGSRSPYDRYMEIRTAVMEDPQPEG